MEGLQRTPCNEHHGNEIEEPVEKTLTAVLAAAVLAPKMFYLYLINLEPLPTRQNGYEPMQLTVYGDASRDFAPIRLEATVEIMQINAGHSASRPVIKFARQVFGQQGVMALLLPAGNHVEALFRDHLIQFRDLIRAILQVSIHSNDDIALSGLEASVQCRRPKCRRKSRKER